MIPAIIFIAMLALVPIAGNLANRMAHSLNAEWRTSALDWMQEVGIQGAEFEKHPILPVVAPQQVAQWLLGAVTALLTAIWVWQHPADTLGAGLAMVLGFALLLAIFVDLYIQILPDTIVWVLATLGAAISVFGYGVEPEIALSGALAGGCSLWALATGFRLLRGHEGLGLGDVKLVSMTGLWLGWEPLPWLLLIASGSAILLHLAIFRGAAEQRLAFGPALAIAFLVLRLI